MSDKTTLAQEKRNVARRARRLANTLWAEDDRARLIRYELDMEAAALEQSTATFVLRPDVAPHQQTQQQQVQQQQQSADSPTQPPVPKRTE